MYKAIAPPSRRGREPDLSVLPASTPINGRVEVGSCATMPGGQTTCQRLPSEGPLRAILRRTSRSTARNHYRSVDDGRESPELGVPRVCHARLRFGSWSAASVPTCSQKTGEAAGWVISTNQKVMAQIEGWQIYATARVLDRQADRKLCD